MIIKGDMQQAGGVEFATFRLREGVTEADLLALSRRVESEFLLQQSELIMHCLLRGADGLYADVVMAPASRWWKPIASSGCTTTWQGST